MMRLSSFLFLAPLLISVQAAQAQRETPTKEVVEAGTPIYVTGLDELGLEGVVQGIDAGNGQITILATAFSTPAGRKEIVPTKPKTLVTTGKTRFFDERAGRDFDLSDIAIGRSLRVVGRDTGTGKPLEARLVLWRSPEPSEPRDPDTPEVLDGLLPPSKIVNGVKVSVFDAGFEAEKKLFDWGTDTTPTFFLAFRTLAPAGAEGQKPWWQWAKFVGLIGPNGQMHYGRGAGEFGQSEGGRALIFPDIDPRWRSVTARWEVNAGSNAPVDANGQYAGDYEITGLAPSLAHPRVEPKTTAQTPQGTIYRLESIECDYGQKTTTIILAIDPPPGIAGLQIGTYPTAITDDKGTNLRSKSFTRGELKKVTIRTNALPAPGAKSISIAFRVEESAPIWKRPDFYPFIDMQIPVAALVKAQPPTLNVGSKANSYMAQNDVMEARLDERHRSDMRWWGTVWVQPRRDTDAIKTLVEEVVDVSGGRAVTTDGRRFEIATQVPDDLYFHGDNSSPTPQEQSLLLKFDIDGDMPKDPVRVELDTIQTRRLLHTFDITNVPIPGDEAPVTYEPVPGADSLSLQKIAVVKGQSAQKMAALMGNNEMVPLDGALVLVFAFERALPEANLSVQRFQLGERSIPVRAAGDGKWASGWIGDALTGDKTAKAWTLILPQAEVGVRASNLHLELLEQTEDEKSAPIVIENIVVKPDEGKD